MPDRPTRDVQQFVQGAIVLHVSDVRATAQYYRDVLGFTFDFGDESYAVVWRENAAVHLLQGDGMQGGVERGGFHLFFWVEDVDALHDELAQRGAGIVAPPETQPYGLREFALLDCNGTRLLFAMDVD
jgi:predicted enzyme related to lactoylglutathione lyase